MFISYYNNTINFSDTEYEYSYHIPTQKIIKVINKQHPLKYIQELYNINLILFCNDCLNNLTEKQYTIRTLDFYNNVCNILFTQDEQSEEYKTLEVLIGILSELYL